METYKNLTCIGCGYNWNSKAKSPRCPKCYKRKFETAPVKIPEYKKLSQKIITDVQKIKKLNYTTKTPLEVIKTPLEVEEVEEIGEEIIKLSETGFKCSECGGSVSRDNLYCLNCGARLLWEYLKEFNEVENEF